MATKRPSPRQTLAVNLKGLIDLHKTSGPRVAEKAGIDPKSVNNILNGRFSPNLEHVDAIAQVFGLDLWDLIQPSLMERLADRKEVDKLVSSYRLADPEDQKRILGVAEMAAKYSTK